MLISCDIVLNIYSFIFAYFDSTVNCTMPISEIATEFRIKRIAMFSTQINCHFKYFNGVLCSLVNNI